MNAYSYARPASARLASNHSVNIPVAGILKTIPAGKLSHLVRTGPVEVRFALAKIKNNEPLCPMEIEACRVYFTQAVPELN